MLETNGAEEARRLAQWKHRIREAWPGVSMQLMLQPQGASSKPFYKRFYLTRLYPFQYLVLSDTFFKKK